LLRYEEAEALEKNCKDFMLEANGAKALAMSTEQLLSHNEMFRKQGSAFSPLYLAHYAYGQIYDSRLPFDRELSQPYALFASVFQSCRVLLKDFSLDLR
jgi:hypothetical protein